MEKEQKETIQLLADNFTNVYSLSKTLRFELRPQGKTKEFIERDGILDTDIHRAESYKKVKKLIDGYHKVFIDEVLSTVSLDGLDEYSNLYSNAHRSDKEEKEFEKLQTDLRKQIATAFSSHPQYKVLFNKELIKKELLEFYSDDEDSLAYIREFSDFTTYFTNFHNNRKNMYSDEAKSTAIAYRIIHDNLPKYLDNIKIFQHLCETDIKEKLPQLLTQLQAKIALSSIEDYFTIDGFNYVLSQSGIDIYNAILGAFSEENQIKVQGLNEYINLYNQHLTGEQKKREKLPQLKPLFKQILTDRESLSFLTEQFEDDEEVFEAVDVFYQALEETILSCEHELNVQKLFEGISNYDLKHIFINNDSALTNISNALFDNWAVLRNAISEHYDQNTTSKKKGEKYEEEKQKSLNKIKVYSISQLNTYAENYLEKKCHIEEYFSNNIIITLNKIREAYAVFKKAMEHLNEQSGSLQKNDSLISVIKNLLDALKELQSMIKPLKSGILQSNKDELFYGEYIRIWEQLDAVTLLYNMVRNYVTKKPYSIEKVKLNFNRSTLLDGWDKNKETANLGVILIKDDLYYLGIINHNCSKVIENAPTACESNRYQKMEYKLLPGPNKMLPKVFFSKKRINEFAPTPELYEKYQKGTHKKGDNFCLDDCHQLIDFFKNSINKHEEWSQFQFQFSDTETYSDISGFYREVEHQGYKIDFRDIDASYIDELVDNGQLYLFQIYNKDFSPYSKGTPNLHTLYWKMLFHPDNLSDVVYKLNGGAEVFFRKASIDKEDIIKHEANKPIKNKYPNAEKKESIFEYDIVKDKRFTVDKFQFHVPITLNFKAENETYLNYRVNRMIHDAKDMHIIGIDRGERNLLYVTVVNMQGQIVKQLSLNEIIAKGRGGEEYCKDYQLLLDNREKENKHARQNWTQINTIKELKEGYLSQAIHVITSLMIEYNAIVVLEDLNMGFMRGRQKFEKQIYQKFEKMLIDKLNYLVDKKKEATENGGLLQAYQLTNHFESFTKLGKQSGFLYYVPAWNTSKLDPTTGFVNLFYTRYETIEKTREFIKKFDSIIYNAQNDWFEFSFDYSNFTTKAEGTQTKWTVCSAGTRLEHYRNEQQNNEWDIRCIDVTSQIKHLLEEHKIDYTNGDLRNVLIDVEGAKFYKKFMKIFSLVLQMRNSSNEDNIDELVSPVLNKNNEFFVTGAKESYPLDADANGAYNIARKGLWIVEQIQSTPLDELDKKLKLAISNKEWLKYAQEHTL